jgi:hypothetical protein
MTTYTVRFERGNRDWTCSVFEASADGRTVGAALVSGSGTTKDRAKDQALTLTHDPALRAALASADHSRPYWVQGALGQQQEAQRKAAAHQAAATRRQPKPARP